MTPISDAIFVVTDIETTGSDPIQNHIMDISCILVKNEEILYTYNSLINPHQNIPEFIQKMTGITENITKSAPEAAQIMQDVYEILSQDAVCFVAHNYVFDWSFIKESLKQENIVSNFDIPKICTLKLARKLISKNIKKNVGDLSNYFNIPIVNRHRAFCDALATAYFFIELLQILKDKYNVMYVEDIIKFQNIKTLKYIKLNIQIKEKLNSYLKILPPKYGIIKFINENKKIIHITKTNNLREHFLTYIEAFDVSTSKVNNILKEFVRIEWIETNSELENNLLFYDELIKYQPKYNYIPLKEKIKNVDQELISSIIILENSKQEKTVDVFFIYKSRFIKLITVGIKANLTEIFNSITDIYYNNIYDDIQKDYFKIKIVNNWIAKYFPIASVINFKHQAKHILNEDIKEKISEFYINK